MRQRLFRGLGIAAVCALLGCTSVSLETAAVQTAASETPAPIVNSVTVTAAPTTTHAPAPTPTPTLAPTAAPTEAPTPIPTQTPEPTPEPITEERLASGEFDRYFDDAVFIGDSLTRSFSNYTRLRREREEHFLGTAQFLGTVSMSVKNASADRASSDGITFYYRGKAVSVTEGINRMEAKKAFIMLGLNDIGSRTWESVEGYFNKLIDTIQEKCPDTEIVMQGILPVTEQYLKNNGHTAERWNSFNEILARICEEQGVDFLDFSKEVMTESGALREDYSSDKLFHLNEDGEQVWIRALRLYAAKKMYPDAALSGEPLS